MRGWVAVVFWLCLGAGCSAPATPAETPIPTPASRPTPSGPTPSLPLARPVTPSPAVSPGLVASGQQTATARVFALQSSAFVDGAALPVDYTCDGAGQSPPLAWSGAPPGTTAYALIELDTDASTASEPVTQWLLYNMPRTVTQLAAGVPPRPLLTNGSQQGLNSHQSVGYSSPCPDKGGTTHRVTFDLFAQDGYVTLETGAAVDAVRDALAGHTLSQAQLTATVQR
ncbi:MAG TPA: YbhB/YbcL family Raf kinase inhibitor-like protein [Chloroflexota bacterium]